MEGTGARVLGGAAGRAMPVSAVALGCAGISGVRSRAELGEAQLESGVAAIAAAWAAGITFFDFADIYGGGSAEMVWKAATAAVPGLAAGAVLCTKAAVRPAAGDAPYHYNASPAHLEAALEGSLGRLGVDHVDLLLIHRPDPLTHPRETAGALGAMVRDGRVRAVGVSNHTPAQIRALQAHLDIPLAASQPSLSLWNLQPTEDGTLDICEELGLLPMAYSPLGGGLLAGRRSLADGDARQPRLAGLLAELERCAGAHGCTTNQVALAWLLAHPAQVVPIVGSRNPDHIREAAAARDVRLSREDWYRLFAAGRGLRLP